MKKTREDLYNLASILRAKGWEVEEGRGTPSFPWPFILVKKSTMVLPFFISLCDGYLISTNRLDDPPVETSIKKVDGKNHYTIEVLK